MMQGRELWTLQPLMKAVWKVPMMIVWEKLSYMDGGWVLCMCSSFLMNPSLQLGKRRWSLWWGGARSGLLGAALRSLFFNPFHFVSPKLVSRDALPLPTFYSCSFTPIPSELTSSISHVSAVTKTYRSLQSTIRKRIQSSTLFVKTLGSSPPHVISHLLLMISYLKRLCKIPLSRT